MADPNRELSRSLYHYTDAAGLLGILQTSTIWATDAQFLNDETELLYARDLIRDAVASLPVPMSPTYNEETRAQYKPYFEEYRARVLNNLNDPDWGIYVACFCELGDLLSQWRGYAPGHGYAIEFDAATLSEYIEGIDEGISPSAGLSKVRYGHAEAAPIVEQAMGGVRITNGQPVLGAPPTAFRLTTRMSNVKDPGFAEEAEWRVVVGFMDAPGTQSWTRGGFELSFRAAPMAVVPYVPIRLPRNAIRSVRVGPGPNAEHRMQGLMKLLAVTGTGAAIDRSLIPLRS